VSVPAHHLFICPAKKLATGKWRCQHYERVAADDIKKIHLLWRRAPTDKIYDKSVMIGMESALTNF